MMDLKVVRFFVVLSVIVYFAFDHWDSKRIADEREELIRLKTYELVHKSTLLTLSVFSLLYFFNPSMNAVYPLLFAVAATLYAEIAGKLYFRRKY